MRLEPELRWTETLPIPDTRPTDCPWCGANLETWEARERHINSEHPNAGNPNPYAVGSIWHTSWGYDQTNVEFYVVVRETKASVWLVPMTSEYRNGREFPGSTVLWSTDATDEHATPSMHRKGKHGTYLRLDYVRHAWPYDGGGVYSTDAAGVCGH